MPVAQFDIGSLWVNTLLVQPLEDHAQHSARLGALVDAGKAETLFEADDPAVNWLKANVIHGISALLGNAGFTSAPQVAVTARVEAQTLGAFAPMRNQPGAYLTGVYVVRAPAGQPVLGARDDGCPGSISFYDPRVGMNMNAIRKDPYVLYHHTIKFEPGLLIIWPGYVPYFVHPHLSDEPAVRIWMDARVVAG